MPYSALWHVIETIVVANAPEELRDELEAMTDLDARLDRVVEQADGAVEALE